MESDDDSDPDEFVRWSCSLRNPRSVATSDYSGEFLNAVNSTHLDIRLRGRALPPHERNRRSQDSFRLLEADFDELQQLYTSFLHEYTPRTDLRFYSLRTQLLVTLHFLALCHTLRSVAQKFELPPNSFSQCCIHRGVAVLRYVLLVNSAAKDV
jgi:hypothetical protein